MKLFISIVSHLDHDIIINLGSLKRLIKYESVQVVCRDNKPIKKLKLYCEKYGITYLGNKHQKGFSSNNNENYLYCQQNLGMQKGDYFLMINPDLFINDEYIINLFTQLEVKQPSVATCNLYLDREYMVHDDNIRTFPSFTNFVKTYLFNDRSTMVKRGVDFRMGQEHWASCSFMAIKTELYAQLRGLDEAYYMYCEDIDLCHRAKLAGHVVTYIEETKAVHYRRCDSKRFLSKYFFWHVASVLRYSFCAKKVQASKSILTEINLGELRD